MPRWQGAYEILEILRQENIKALESIVFRPIEEVIREAEERVEREEGGHRAQESSGGT